MKKLILLSLALASIVNAQVCCSPIGSGQSGGGSNMNTWIAQWPNTLIRDDIWHWMVDIQVANQGPVGNITYGPQLNSFFEVSRSISRRQVLFLDAYAGIGSLEEKVTYTNSSTISYSGGISGGLKVAIGNQGRTFAQFLFNIPASIQYTNAEFPFDSEEGSSGGLLILHNQPMPWAQFSPDLLSSLSLSWQYMKNTEVRDNILSDHRNVMHISSSIHSWYPIFLAPFIQLKSEQLLAPPSIWTDARETRLLSSASAGIDLALSKPGWENIKLRIGFPLLSWSSSNGFPDGTQPAAYFFIAANAGGILNLNGIDNH